MSTNPLSKHFRTPSVYMKLPSGGKYWEEGSLELTVAGELAVLPMTSRDEILLRTPDALMNGESVTQVMQSCCPGIINAWKMPSIDVDAVLIAIRVASYGNEMAITGICPACNESNEYDVPLNTVLAGIKAPGYNAIVSHDLKIKLKPLAYFSVNAVSQLAFEEQQMLKFIADDTITGDERKRLFTANLNKLVDINLRSITDSTEYIELADGTRVYNPEHIKEFYDKAERTLIGVIKAELASIKEQADIKPVDVTCNECGHQSKLALQFDYASFFGNGS